MDDLTGFQRDLLVVLAGLEQPNGQEVTAALEPYYEEELTASRVYSNLEILAGTGLVEKDRPDQHRNAYTLTAAGEARLRTHRAWVAQHIDAGRVDERPPNE